MKTLQAFIRDERGLSSADLPAWAAKYGVVLLILNEVRGVIVAGSIAMQVWG